MNTRKISKNLRTLLFVAGMMLFLQPTKAQQRTIWLEDFNGNLPPTGWNATPNDSWKANPFYSLPGPFPGNPQSYHGVIPTLPGNTAILETDIYDCRNFEYVYLRFSHICKVSPRDTVRIEYRINVGNVMGNWGTLLPAGNLHYLGSASNYATTGFNTESYPEWITADSTDNPQQSW